MFLYTLAYSFGKCPPCGSMLFKHVEAVDILASMFFSMGSSTAHSSLFFSALGLNPSNSCITRSIVSFLNNVKHFTVRCVLTFLAFANLNCTFQYRSFISLKTPVILIISVPTFFQTLWCRNTSLITTCQPRPYNSPENHKSLPSTYLSILLHNVKEEGRYLRQGVTWMCQPNFEKYNDNYARHFCA